MAQGKFRIEKDSMGEMKVPAEALYAAQTQRAVENFPISDLRFKRPFIRALGLIKANAAAVNISAGRMPRPMGGAIEQAAREVAAGRWDSHFPLDIFQTGSGTSTNMNANEVIANRAKQILGGSIPVHPNDHVNMGQSSNDVIPTATHVSACELTATHLLPAMEHLHKALKAKEKQFHKVIKSGRTHLMDATPVRLGQEFSGYARQIEVNIQRVKSSLAHMLELALGGTAVGTGINMPKGMNTGIIKGLVKEMKLPFKEAKNHFEAQATLDKCVAHSGALKALAVSLTKIANDLRWLGSGPRTGIFEISLPEVQPGSSIMPGKVNPVICESAIMASCQVIGNDAAITVGGLGGVGSLFELNVAMPVIAHNLLESISILGTTCRNLADQCVAGIKANEARCKALLDLNLIRGTALNRVVGYDKAAYLIKKAFKENRSLRDVCLEEKIMDPKALDKILDPSTQV